MLVTDAPVLEQTTGPALSVMHSGLPADEPTAALEAPGDRAVSALAESVLIN